MAIFGGAKARNREPAGGLSVIAPGVTVRGDIESNGVVKIEGAVHGNVRAAAQVLVAKGGGVRGDIDTREAIIGGSVEGSTVAGERVELQPGALVHGDITTPRITVSEGAQIDGRIRMGAQDAQSSLPRPSPAPGNVTGQPGPLAAQVGRPSIPFARVAVPPRASGTEPNPR